MNFQCGSVAPAVSLAVAALLCAPASRAQDAEDLAKKLSNPVAAMISVPFQYNYDHRYGTDDSGHKSVLNVQPVVPIELNADWNLISRTIVPIVSQTNIQSGTSQSGLGDITQSFFFSPKKPGAGGLIWGVGPVLLLPTGTDSALSARKWGAGPTFVLLKQEGPWTYGMLANHIWAGGGDSNRPSISNTFVQPFLSYTTKDAWTYGINTESTYDWKNRQWSVPINFTVGKLIKVGTQPINLTGGLRYWAEGPDSGPKGLGLRFVVTFLFPK
ncbi:transporter [Variovorax robiniae]|uniref:Transporter n=1 Tax=Variovorax robiniae TaxID=1836199 RepID=A0ABU8XG15_9BURK